MYTHSWNVAKIKISKTMPVLKNCIHTVSKNMQKKDRQFSFNFDFAIRPNRTDKHIPDRKMFLHVVQMLRLLC